ncbi:TPA: hypothetical protein ACH3X1_014972 [Trebouxia sp. C0004]
MTSEIERDERNSAADATTKKVTGLAGLLQSARNSINRNMEPFLEGLHKVDGGSTDSGYESDSEASVPESPRADGVSVSQREPVLRSKLKKLSEIQLKPEQVLIRDKLGFFLGVVNLCLSAYWLGGSPQTFYKYYTAKAVVLYGSRFYLYKSKNWHYYMLEFCYFANILLLLEVWVFPQSPTFHKIVFAQVAGPLTWSIVALRNSLVLHSLDKITSLFMHISPALVCWAWRWYPDPSVVKFDQMSAEQLKAYNTASWWDIGVLSMGSYMIWVVLYYIKVFVLSQDNVKNKGYVTLFQYMTKNKKSLFARVVMSAPEVLQPVVYMGIHVVLCWLATMTAMIWWHSKTAHTLFLIFCASVSAWNGATYYFDIFARKYIQSLGIEPKPAKKVE